MLIPRGWIGRATFPLYALVTLGTPASAAQTTSPPFVVALLRAEPVTSLDYLDAQSRTTLMVEGQIMEGLVGFNKDSESASRLAKTAHQIDRHTYVFRLRKDIFFHPHRHRGQDQPKELVTAEDVAFSLLRAKNSPSATQFRFNNIETVRVVNQDLVKITLVQADDDFLSRLATAMGHVTCKEYYESLGRDDASRKAAFAKAPIGTGPYLLTRPLAEAGAAIALLRFKGYRNPKWVQSRKAIERVEFRYYDSSAAIVAGLERGEVGLTSMMLSALGAGGLIDARKTPGYEGIRLNPPFLSILAINLKKPKLADPLIRKMLNAAVDKDKIREACPQLESQKDLPSGYHRYLEISQSYLQSKSANELQKLKARPEAQRLLQVLHSRGPLTILVRAGEDVTRDRIVRSVAQDLARHLGLTVNIRKTHQFAAELFSKRPSYDLVYVDWTPDTPGEREGLSILYPLFYSKSSFNVSRLSDPEIDRIFEQIEEIVDEAAADRLYSRIQTRLLENPPHIWLPSVRSDIILHAKGYETGFGSSLLVYYSSFLKDVWRIPK